MNWNLDRRGARSAYLMIVLPALFGCMLVNPWSGPPPVEDDGCSDDHDQFWAPDERGAQIELDGEPADAACNKTPWYSGGGGQGGDVFHFEPELRVTGSFVPVEFPVLESVLETTNGELVERRTIEVYDEDFVRDDRGFYVRPRVLLEAGDRGKNFVVTLTLDVESSEPAGGQPDSEQLSASAGVYVSQ